jgi:hypothetical protein
MNVCIDMYQLTQTYALQIELTEMKSDMASQRTVLEGVNAEHAEVAQRLLEVCIYMYKYIYICIYI